MNDLNLFKLDYDHFSFNCHYNEKKIRVQKTDGTKKRSKWKQKQKHLSSHKMNTLFSMIVCVVCDVCINPKNCWIDSIYSVRSGRLCVAVCIISEKILPIYFAFCILRALHLNGPIAKAKAYAEYMNYYYVLKLYPWLVLGSLCWSIKYNFIQVAEKQNFWNSNWTNRKWFP